jgi:tellurite resistance protein
VERARAHFDERQVVDRVMGTCAEVARSKGRYESLVARWGDSAGSG